MVQNETEKARLDALSEAVMEDIKRGHSDAERTAAARIHELHEAARVVATLSWYSHIAYSVLAQAINNEVTPPSGLRGDYVTNLDWFATLDIEFDRLKESGEAIDHCPNGHELQVALEPLEEAGVLTSEEPEFVMWPANTHWTAGHDVEVHADRLLEVAENLRREGVKPLL